MSNPFHTVSVPTFQLAQSEVTVSQYRTCVDRGDCRESNRRKYECNWNVDLGNVYEWIEDNYGRYTSTPTDGSAHVITRGRYRTYGVSRGGSYLSTDRQFLTSYDRKPMRKQILVSMWHAL